MAETTPLGATPGIQRDGTNLDSARYTDGGWVRFQRGRPKKIGGYKEIADNVNGPVYGLNVWSDKGTNLITCFSEYGVEEIQVNANFIGASIIDRTPAAFVANPNYVWQFATLYDSAAGSDKTLLIAHAGDNLVDIDSSTVTDVFYSEVVNSGVLVAIGSTLQVSGGIVAIAPYLVGYGSDGFVSWSNQNEPRNFTTGDAGTARITDKKIVKGLPMRGSGQSPSALLWSIDSVIRMSYIQGPAVFKFDTLTNESSILSSSGVIEYDGNFYWAGIDRFLMFNGQVQELPNDQNVNWFYDNLNFAQRQKVHVVKIARFGEIWWFYPVGDDEECSKAVVYNVREKYWYDVELGRTSACKAQSVRYPVMVDSEASIETVRLGLTGITGNFMVGDTVSGDISHATGTVVKTVGDFVFMKNVVGTFDVSTPETVTGTNGVGTADTTINVPLYSVWLHEIGYNKIVGDNELSIRSFIETDEFSYLTGGPGHGASKNIQTRMIRIEPDFIMTGTMTVQVVGEPTAQGTTTESEELEFNSTTEMIDLREQRRIMRLRFTSDCLSGSYEMGKLLVSIDEGDTKV